MNTVRDICLIAAKGRSTRFPGKNAVLIGGVLAAVPQSFQVFVAADDTAVVQAVLAAGHTATILAHPTVTDTTPIAYVWRHMAAEIGLGRCDRVYCPLASTVGLTVYDFNAAQDMLSNSNPDDGEIRQLKSYCKRTGEETGLFACFGAILLDELPIGAYTGCVLTSAANHIHYESDL